jgi:hypothetical protein
VIECIQVVIECKYLHILCVVCVIAMCLIVFYYIGYVLLYVYVLLYCIVLLYSVALSFVSVLG